MLECYYEGDITSDNIIKFQNKKQSDSSCKRSNKLSVACGLLSDDHISTDVEILRYILFCFVLSNDIAGLRCTLEHIQELYHGNLWITIDQISCFELNILDGMLANKAYANIFQDFLRSLSYNAQDIKDFIGNIQQSDEIAGSIKQFNLLELAAYLCDTYQSG